MKEAVQAVDSNRFSVTSATDTVICVTALASEGDAIAVSGLIGDMQQHGFHLGYVVPDAREFQFKKV